MPTRQVTTMLVLRSPEDVGQVEDAYMRALLAQRFREMAVEGYTYDELGIFIVVQPGDTVVELEKEGGIWITSPLFGDAHYGDPDFAPCFEFLERHAGHCFEMVHILNDDGYGVIMIVPEIPGIDDVLLRFCNEYAEIACPILPPESGDLYAPGA